MLDNETDETTIDEELYEIKHTACVCSEAICGALALFEDAFAQEGRLDPRACAFRAIAERIASDLEAQLKHVSILETMLEPVGEGNSNTEKE